MIDLGDLVHRLRNTPVRDIIRAVERDGFLLRRETATGYHHGGDTLTRKTLRSVLQALQWTEDDLKRLDLFR